MDEDDENRRDVLDRHLFEFYSGSVDTKRLAFRTGVVRRYRSILKQLFEFATNKLASEQRPKTIHLDVDSYLDHQTANELVEFFQVCQLTKLSVMFSRRTSREALQVATGMQGITSLRNIDLGEGSAPFLCRLFSGPVCYITELSWYLDFSKDSVDFRQLECAMKQSGNHLKKIELSLEGLTEGLGISVVDALRHCQSLTEFSLDIRIFPEFFDNILARFVDDHPSLCEFVVQDDEYAELDISFADALVQSIMAHPKLFKISVPLDTCRSDLAVTLLLNRFAPRKDMNDFDLGCVRAKRVDQDFHLLVYKFDGTYNRLFRVPIRGRFGNGNNQIWFARLMDGVRELRDLTRLELEECFTTDVGRLIKQVVMQPFCRIHDLALTECSYGHAQFQQLCLGLAHYRHLTKLELSFVDPVPVQDLCPLSRLEDVSFTFRMGPVAVAVQSVAAFLIQQRYVKVFNLYFSEPRGYGGNEGPFSDLAAAVGKHPVLETLKLAGRRRLDHFSKPLFAALARNKVLRHLDLHYRCDIDVDALVNFIPQNNTIQQLLLPAADEIPPEDIMSKKDLDRIYTAMLRNTSIVQLEYKYARQTFILDQHPGIGQVIRRNQLLRDAYQAPPMLVHLPRSLWPHSLAKFGSNHGEASPLFHLLRTGADMLIDSGNSVPRKRRLVDDKDHAEMLRNGKRRHTYFTRNADQAQLNTVCG